MDLPGPFPVGRYAKTLRDELRKRARVRLLGEITGLRQTPKQAYFELRDAEGAVPCTIWADELARLQLPEGALRDGAEFVAAGGPDYFIGSATSSPGISFRVTHLRPAGEGDLLARLDALRKQLRAEGLTARTLALIKPKPFIHPKGDTSRGAHPAPERLPAPSQRSCRFAHALGLHAPFAGTKGAIATILRPNIDKYSRFLDLGRPSGYAIASPRTGTVPVRAGTRNA